MGILSSIVSAGASLFGARSSAKAEEKANVDRSNEAQANRDFQLMMSSTAHQREVKDLIAAGINPVLTATGGKGASTGAGSTARVESTKPKRGELYSSTAEKGGQLAVSTATAKLLSAQASTARSQAKINNQMANIQTSKYGKWAMWANVLGKPVTSAMKTAISAVGVGVAGKAIKGIKAMKQNKWNFRPGGKP